MAFSDAELKSFWTPREENVLLLAELFVRLADMSNMSSLISIQITTGVGVSWLVQGSKHEERTILSTRLFKGFDLAQSQTARPPRPPTLIPDEASENQEAANTASMTSKGS